jgi:hypothetical protein
MKTLEQVIMDIAAHNWSSFVDKEEESAAIAEAVRGWLDELVKGEGHPYQSAVRIKELEAEVARLKDKAVKVFEAGSDHINELIDKAAKYDELREKFPFLPGGNFWTLFQESVCKWTVEKIWFNDDGRLCLTGYRERGNEGILESPRYKASECHPTADACRAAIPVEE